MVQDDDEQSRSDTSTKSASTSKHPSNKKTDQELRRDAKRLKAARAVNRVRLICFLVFAGCAGTCGKYFRARQTRDLGCHVLMILIAVNPSTMHITHLAHRSPSQLLFRRIFQRPSVLPCIFLLEKANFVLSKLR